MNNLTHRYMARIIVEAETPLTVGSGENNILTNQMVVTDINGLPYIPGTSLAGVLRHALEQELTELELNKIMGFQGERKTEGPDDGQGSRLIVSHAQMIGHEGIPIDGITKNQLDDPFYKPFQNLPVRQHVRISHKGTSEDKGKFDEQVVYKGTRFCFELELVSDRKEESKWKKMLEQFYSPAFRIGGGTRKGFGELSIIECKTASLDLSNEDDLDLYLEKTSSLNDEFWNNKEETSSIENSEDNWITYKLHLKPDDFFLFSSGLESADAKMIPVTEKIVKWDKPDNPEFSEEKTLVPASSVKGALAHRVAFYYNKLHGLTAEKLKESSSINEIVKGGFYDFRNKANDKFNSAIYEDRLKLVTTYNPAVRALFGFALDDDKDNGAKRGNAIFSDVHLDNEPKKKLLNHVAIDRFTGGAIDGALFSEEVAGSMENQEKLDIKILVHKTAFEHPKVKEAFELALKDICTGMLPLGGGTMRGHGCFNGIIIKNGKELKNEK